MDYSIRIEKTEDGSYTLYNPEFDEHYHSRFGALTESLHVFIQSGLSTQLYRDNISILEIGFGTGLNALLSFQELRNSNQSCVYVGIDTFPVDLKIFDPAKIEISENTILDVKLWSQIIATPWNEAIEILENQNLLKIEANMLDYAFSELFDCIYFDAFAPDKQPELWTAAVFAKLYRLLNNGGVLTTYSSKGQVRRNMIEAGFRVEKIPGPPHKREMLRAWKD